MHHHTACSDTPSLDDALSGLSDDPQDADYGDHLSEQMVDRLRSYLPRDTVAFGTVDAEYAEALIERTEVINGQEVDVVTTAMVDPRFAADRLRGTLLSSPQVDDVELALIYEATDAGFRYRVFHGGRWIASFRSLRVATVAFRAMDGHRPELFSAIVSATYRRFKRRR